jgi:hypothetical protein
MPPSWTTCRRMSNGVNSFLDYARDILKRYLRRDDGKGKLGPTQRLMEEYLLPCSKPRPYKSDRLTQWNQSLHRSGRRRYVSDKQPKTQAPDDGRRWKISTNMHHMHHRQAIEKKSVPGEIIWSCDTITQGSQRHVTKRGNDDH